MTGAPSRGSVYYDQKVMVSGKKNDIFTVGGWAYVIASASHTNKPDSTFGIRVYFYGSTSAGVEGARFSRDEIGWQFASGVAIAPCDYTCVRVRLTYNYNMNCPCFTNVFLHKEAYGQGNLKTIRGLCDRSILVALFFAFWGEKDELFSFKSPFFFPKRVRRMSFGMDTAA